MDVDAHYGCKRPPAFATQAAMDVDAHYGRKRPPRRHAAARMDVDAHLDPRRPRQRPPTERHSPRPARFPGCQASSRSGSFVETAAIHSIGTKLAGCTTHMEERLSSEQRSCSPRCGRWGVGGRVLGWGGVARRPAVLGRPVGLRSTTLDKCFVTLLACKIDSFSLFLFWPCAMCSGR